VKLAELKEKQKRARKFRTVEVAFDLFTNKKPRFDWER
jgi:hypothetical protein